MRNRVRRSALSATALAVCTVLFTDCSSGGPFNFTPLATTVLNRTYHLISSGNAAHIGGFVGPIHNSAPHAQQGADYYSDVDAIFTIEPDDTGTACSAATFTLDGRLTNPKEGAVYIDLSGAVAGGTMTFSGIVKGADAKYAGTITGTYKIDGGSCQVGETQFTTETE